MRLKREIAATLRSSYPAKGDTIHSNRFEDLGLAVETDEAGVGKGSPNAGCSIEPANKAPPFGSRVDDECVRDANSFPPVDLIGSARRLVKSESAKSWTEAPVTIANGTTVDIRGPSAWSVAFAGTTGTLKLEDPLAFTGLISGLSGADAIDLSGFAYGANVTATYLGNATGGTLTVTEGTKTARVALSGNYLSSSWTLSSDGKGRHGRRRSQLAANSPRSAAAASSEAWISPPTAPWSGVPTPTALTYGTDPRGCNSSPHRACRRRSISLPEAKASTKSKIADSNTNIFYMQYDGYIFKSTNKGTTWTQTAFAQQTADRIPMTVTASSARRWPLIRTTPTSSMRGTGNRRDVRDDQWRLQAWQKGGCNTRGQ